MGFFLERTVNLVDQFGRQHIYLRISLTERCNFRCQYCMPPEGIPLQPRDNMLSFEEVITLARVFIGMGVKKIRLTGGEPLVRKDVVDLCKRLSAIGGLEKLALTTNGSRLTQMAEELRSSGVKQINISLDSLRPDRFSRITLRNELAGVLSGIDSAMKARFESLKINVVLMRGVNDDELIDFVDFAVDRSLNIRFIEYMPFRGNGWSEARFMPYREMLEVIQTKYVLTPSSAHKNGTTGLAKDFCVEGSQAMIGFITTMSEHFCDSCNRLRLTADGKMKNCLFAESDLDLKALLRSGVVEYEIEKAILAHLQEKWGEHPDVLTILDSQHRPMITMGG